MSAFPPKVHGVWEGLCPLAERIKIYFFCTNATLGAFSHAVEQS